MPRALNLGVDRPWAAVELDPFDGWLQLGVGDSRVSRK